MPEPTATPTLLDAINTSLEELKPAESKAAEVKDEDADGEETETETGAAGTADGETSTDEESGEGKDGKKAGEGADDKTGEKKEETAEEKAAREAAETPEQKATREAAETAAAAAKKLDPINDPIPATVSQRTRERITALVKEVKDRDGIVEQHRELFGQIQSTGVSPDSFAQTLTVLRLFNSDKIEDKRQAYTFLQSQVAHLAKEIGETIPGVDPLEGHQDLIDSVAAQAITQAHAQELAAARNRAAAATAATTRSTQTQEQINAEYTSAYETAKSSLNALGVTLSGVDPNYKARAAAIITKLQPEFKTLHPSKWVARFQEEYTAAAKVPSGTPAAAATPKGQPLRPNKQPAGGGNTKAPTSALEAMEAGLSALKS